MCTAVTYKTKDFYFGRNLDLEYSYNERVTITPRNYPISFCKEGKLNNHFAIIGMSYIQDNYPLYYDATNEKGLSMAGLNFPDNADYKDFDNKKINISPYEFILYILSKYSNVNEVKNALKDINLVSIPFSDKLPLAPLHWIIADKTNTITVESVEDGIKIYDNKVGVLTNNPPFDYHINNLNNYLHLSAKEPDNTFCKNINLSPSSRGMGAVGLPGDYSSVSRFIKASFVKLNSKSSDTEQESVNQFFHILSSVEMPRGCVKTKNDKNDITVYSSCCNCDRGIYYYKTYGSSSIIGVDMYKENLLSSQLISYPLLQSNFLMQN